MSLRVEFHRHRVEVVGRDRRAYRRHAVLRHARGAEQGVAHAVAFDDGVWLVGEGIGGGGRNGFGKIGRAHVELQSLMRSSYAVFSSKKKKHTNYKNTLLYP